MTCCGSNGIGGSVVGPPPPPEGGIDILSDGVPIGPDPFTSLDFEGTLEAVDSGGGLATITGFSTYVLPEQWAENNIQRNFVNRVVDCQLSTHFNTYKVLRSGSITGLSTRLTLPITAGTLVVEITKNGVGIGLSITHTNAANQTGGIVQQARGADTYVAGDLLGVIISTNNTFAPTSTDLEAMIQVTE